jgi:hypothetical protein
MDNALARETLNEAIRLVGGVDNLSRMLGIKKARLVAYDAGTVDIPGSLLLQLEDLISDGV